MTDSILDKFNQGKSLDYEDYIAAYFQAAGFFVEKSIIIREKFQKGISEILEMDFLATEFSENEIKQLLVEIKSGGWGYSDLFKVMGWLQYLEDIYNGGIIVQKEKDDLEKISEIAKNHRINIVLDRGGELSGSLFNAFGVRKSLELDRKVWQLSFLVQRLLGEYLKQRKRSQKECKSFGALDDYYFVINSAIFLTPNRIQRLEKLYEAFWEWPHLSARCAHDELGKSFEWTTEENRIPKEIFIQTFYDGKLNMVQVSTFIEHLGRLHLMKSSIERLILDDERAEWPEPELIVREENGRVSVNLHFSNVPSKLDDVLEVISANPYIHHYPNFWKCFMFTFGGFILDDFRDQEYLFLSQKTGIPVDQIDRALDSYSLFFPSEKGWIVSAYSISFLKLFSAPIMGIGVIYRKAHYSNWNEIEQRLKRNNAVKYLKVWENATMELVNKYFSKKS